jgi:uncharacterized RDD family membrane protein YckC
MPPMTGTVSEPAAALSSPPYASVGARVRALLIDTIVVSLGVVAFIVVGMVASDVPGSGRFMVFGIAAFVLLYEPCMVWRFGGTIGHRRGNLVVVADGTGRNPSLGRAMIRFVVKSASPPIASPWCSRTTCCSLWPSPTSVREIVCVPRASEWCAPGCRSHGSERSRGAPSPVGKDASSEPAGQSSATKRRSRVEGSGTTPTHH